MELKFTLNGRQQSVLCRPGDNVQKLLKQLGMNSVRDSDSGYGFAGSDSVLRRGRSSGCMRSDYRRDRVPRLVEQGHDLEGVLPRIHRRLGETLLDAPGRLGDEPTLPGQRLTVPLTVEGQLTTPEAFAAIVLRAGTDGAKLVLSDVARVEIGRAHV